MHTHKHKHSHIGREKKKVENFSVSKNLLWTLILIYYLNVGWLMLFSLLYLYERARHVFTWLNFKESTWQFAILFKCTGGPKPSHRMKHANLSFISSFARVSIPGCDNSWENWNDYGRTTIAQFATVHVLVVHNGHIICLF